MQGEEFAIWSKKLEFSEPTIKLIERIRTSEPFRAVQSHRRNVKGKYPSHKMGRTIQFESQTVELPFVHLLERDNSVLEYYDQPSEQVKLRYKAGKNEKVIGFTHTPDYFVISKDQAGWVECKDEEELLKLTEESPNRYVRVDGQWRCPPGEAYAEHGLNPAE